MEGMWLGRWYVGGCVWAWGIRGCGSGGALCGCVGLYVGVFGGLVVCGRMWVGLCGGGGVPQSPWNMQVPESACRGSERDQPHLAL